MGVMVDVVAGKDLLLGGDCIAVLQSLPEKSVDLVFADPPYNLQLGGDLTRPDGSSVDGVHSSWDRFSSFAVYDAFTREWLAAARRCMRDDATIWVIGSYHNIYRVGCMMMDMGFWILNDVHWVKSNPMPNFQGKRFQNATETLIWAKKSEDQSLYAFDYHAMKSLNGDVQMRNLWEFPICGGSERLKDKDGCKIHPTQKPEALMYRIILASTKPGDVVLDPFFGTGTTGVAARRLGRHFIGIERDDGYRREAAARLEAVPFNPAPADLLAAGSPRKARQVGMGTLVEEGWLMAGETLRSADGKWNAALKADGTISRGGLSGSIHKVGAALRKSPSCNGWDFWMIERDGRWVALDTIRERRLVNEEIPVAA